MANISMFLTKIKSAIYGEDVRDAIHDAIDAINDDVDNTYTKEEIDDRISKSGGSDDDDTGVGRTTDRNGEIFNDYTNNVALCDNNHAEGTKTIAGYKGFKILSVVPKNDHIEITVRDAELNQKARQYYNTGAKINFDGSKHFTEVATIKEIKMDSIGNSVLCVTPFDYYEMKDPTGQNEKEDWINVTGSNVGEPIVQFYAAHAEGESTICASRSGHAEGRETKVVGNHGHAEGKGTKAGYAAHAEGQNTIALNDGAHAEGGSSKAYGKSAHAEGANTEARGQAAHSEGGSTNAAGDYSHTEGQDTQATNLASHAEGANTEATGAYAHAEGIGTKSTASASHSEGTNTQATKLASHAEGNFSIASAEAAHAEGGNTNASGRMSHAEGSTTKASAEYSHAEGQNTEASHTAAHAEGQSTKASQVGAHAEGLGTEARAVGSHAEGLGTVATADSQHVQGKYNEIDVARDYAHIIGNGTSTAEKDRKNIHTVDWNGNAWYAGTIEAMGIILKSSSPNSKKRFMITIDDGGAIKVTEVVTNG